MTLPRADLARNTLAVLFIGGLILAAFWVLRPFIGPAIWSAAIVVATWPVMRRLQALPGVCCAGEMLDWDAPTGGYLLNASLASGRAAAAAVRAHLARTTGPWGTTQ